TSTAENGGKAHHRGHREKDKGKKGRKGDPQMTQISTDRNLGTRNPLTICVNLCHLWMIRLFSVSSVVSFSPQRAVRSPLAMARCASANDRRTASVFGSSPSGTMVAR